MEFGTTNMLGVASLWAGQDWIEQHGIENIYAHEMRLAKELVEGIRGIERVRLYCCDSLEESYLPHLLDEHRRHGSRAKSESGLT